MIRIVALLWIAGEIVFSATLRRDRARTQNRDRGSFIAIWIGMTAGVVSALVVHRYAPIPLPPLACFAVGLALLGAGFALRLAAVRTLREAFTVTVAIREGQRVIDRGPYAYVRHPAYSGMLLNIAGFGVALGSLASIGAGLIAPALAVAYRIHVEERVLFDAFGDEYAHYAATHKRLVPRIL